MKSIHVFWNLKFWYYLQYSWCSVSLTLLNHLMQIYFVLVCYVCYILEYYAEFLSLSSVFSWLDLLEGVFLEVLNSNRLNVSLEEWSTVNKIENVIGLFSQNFHLLMKSFFIL